MKWFNLSSPNIDELQREVLTLRSTVNSLVVKVEALENEIKRRVLMSDVVSLGQDVQEHGVQLEELIEQVKELMEQMKQLTEVQTDATVNSLAEDKMLAQIANGTTKPAAKPTTRRKPAARK